MKYPPRHKVVIIGCGNVAWHIAKHLHARGNFDIKVINHRPNHLLEEFAGQFECEVQEGFSKEEKADLFFVCVPDRYISSVAKKIRSAAAHPLIIHTSGSARINELQPSGMKCGVMYPLQTFSRKDEVEWKQLPLIIEAKDAGTKKKLKNVASLFSRSVHAMSYEQRSRLHLAAVMVNNFPNALFSAAQNFLAKNGQPAHFNMLFPLMERTVEKATALGPLKAQTGPAKRGDKKIIQRHESLLKKDAELKKIYRLLSKLIARQQKKADA